MQNFKFVIFIAFAVVDAGKVYRATYDLPDEVDQQVKLSFVPVNQYFNCEGEFCATMADADVVMFRGTISGNKLFRITNEADQVAYSLFFRTRSSNIMTIKGAKGTRIDILANIGFPIRDFMPTWSGITCTRIGGPESQIMSFVGTLQSDGAGLNFVPPGSNETTLRIQFTNDIDYNMIIEYPPESVIYQPFKMLWQSNMFVSSTTGMNVRMNKDSNVIQFTGTNAGELMEFVYQSEYGDESFIVSFN